ncbi:MAG: FAD binding domain-containing protein [Bacillota bacterium]
MIKGYVRAKSVQEALQALIENRPWGRVLAGGTDLLPKIRPNRYKKAAPLVLIDIKRIGQLKGITLEDNYLLLGPVTTLSELAGNELVVNHLPVLAEAARAVGSPEIRNRGTVGGNLGSKNPGADLLVPLVALGARVKITTAAGNIEADVQELRSLSGRLGHSALLTGVSVPISPPVRYGYRRWAEKSMGRAYLAALWIVHDQKGTNRHNVRLVLGGANLWPRVFSNISLDDGAEGAATAVIGALEREMQATGGKGFWSVYRRQVARAVILEACEAFEESTRGIRR